MNTLKGLNSMKMKKIVPLALSALLVGTVTVGAQQSDETINGTEVMQQSAAFVQTTGKISSIELLSDDSKRYYHDSEDNPFHFLIDNSTIILDKKGNVVDLKQGDSVTLFMPADQPMIMIYPPLYSPAVIIVGEVSESNFVKVAQFDENIVSEDNQLKLNISDDTIIVNKKGERVSKDEVTKQNAIVIYGSTTKSIPEQTTPYKIIVFPKIEETPEASEILDALIGKDFYEIEGKKMVPLRKVAEGLGYKVEATANGAIVSKGTLAYTITRGEKTYSYNKSLRQFEVAPALLEYGKTYVEYDFALHLTK